MHIASGHVVGYYPWQLFSPASFWSYFLVQQCMQSWRLFVEQLLVAVEGFMLCWMCAQLTCLCNFVVGVCMQHTCACSCVLWVNIVETTTVGINIMLRTILPAFKNCFQHFVGVDITFLLYQHIDCFCTLCMLLLWRVQLWSSNLCVGSV